MHRVYWPLHLWNPKIVLQDTSLRSRSPREPEAVEMCVTHPMLAQQVGVFASLQTTVAAQNIRDLCGMDLWRVQPWKEQPYLCCQDGSGTAVSWEGPGEALCVPQGRTVPSTLIPRPFSTEKTTTRAISLLSLCRQQYWSTKGHISLSALTCSCISNRSVLNICWYQWWDQCTSQSLLFPHGISPLPISPTPRHARPNHKSPREAQFYLRPSQKPLSGACRACLQVCMEIHSPAV